MSSLKQVPSSCERSDVLIWTVSNAMKTFHGKVHVEQEPARRPNRIATRVYGAQTDGAAEIVSLIAHVARGWSGQPVPSNARQSKRATTPYFVE
jgi:hypothetical protein